MQTKAVLSSLNGCKTSKPNSGFRFRSHLIGEKPQVPYGAISLHQADAGLRIVVAALGEGEALN